jgi:diaminopimelate decarboxylase
MGHYTFSGHDTVELARTFQTPLYVMSEDILRSNIQMLKDAFESAGADYAINFAGKSFLCTAMCRIADQMGICLDVVSGGELYCALHSGFDPKRLCMHGNNKSPAEMTMALENGVGRVVIDNENELAIWDELTRSRRQPLDVLFRVTPGISAHTHELIQTATEDSKFGIPIALARQVIARTKEMPYVNTVGIHCHIGSQIVDEGPFLLAMDVMMGLYRDLLADGLPLTELNLGGGFGIPYLTGDEAFDVGTHIPRMVKHIADLAAQYGINMPKIAIEPGRFISATAGITLYTVGTVKTIPGIKKYICVDGGMADNPRPALYDAQYEAIICDRYGDEDESLEKVTVSGKACETDRLIEGALLPAPRTGDILALRHTGAYNFSMSSNYNWLCRPAVVLLRGDAAEVIVRRETYEDLIARNTLPSWLER